VAVEGGGMNAAAGVFFESSNSNGRKSVGPCFGGESACLFLDLKIFFYPC